MSDGAPAPVDRRTSARALVAAMASNTLAVLPVFLLGGLAVFIRRELAFNEFQLGVAVAAFSSTSALAAVPGGRLGERLGPRRGIRAAAVGSGACLLGVAAFARSWSHLVAFLVLGGMANGVAAPTTNLALSRLIPPGRQGLAFGVKQAAIPAAILAAGSAVPLVALTIGWRWAFVSGALAALLVWLVAPQQDGPTRRRTGPVRAGDAATRPLVLLACAAGIGAAAVNAMGAFYVESAVSGGVGEGAAGVWLAAGGASGIAGRVLWGWLADRRDGGHLRVVGLLLAVGAVGVALLAFTPSPLALVAGTTLAFGAGWGWPGLFNFAVVRHNRNAPAAATGITQAGVFVGAFAGPPIFGALVQTAGYPPAWASAAATLVVAAVLVQVGRRSLVHDIHHRAAAAQPVGDAPA